MDDNTVDHDWATRLHEQLDWQSREGAPAASRRAHRRRVLLGAGAGLLDRPTTRRASGGGVPWRLRLRWGRVHHGLRVPRPDPAPVTTIAWRLAHLIVGVFGYRAAAHFGARSYPAPTGTPPTGSSPTPGAPRRRWNSSTPSTPTGWRRARPRRGGPASADRPGRGGVGGVPHGRPRAPHQPRGPAPRCRGGSAARPVPGARPLTRTVDRPAGPDAPAVPPEDSEPARCPRSRAGWDAWMETSARLLRLLSLLQGRRDWSGDELAPNGWA